MSSRMSKNNEAYLTNIKALSDRIVEAQKPIRILDAIKWDKSVKEAFFASNFTQLPTIDKDYYAQTSPLGFDPTEKKAEFHHIEREISRKIGQLNQIGRASCRERV